MLDYTSAPYRQAVHPVALQILFEETLYQKSSKETLLVEILKEKNIIPGIKVGTWTSCTTWLLLNSRVAKGRQCGGTGHSARHGSC